MPNLIRQTLVVLRTEFFVGCIQSLFWLGGFTLLFWNGWKVGVGMLLVWWAMELRHAERKRT